MAPGSGPGKMSTLKTFFSPALVRRIGVAVGHADPRFVVESFVEQASAGLQRLELLDRARHIAAALARYLPAAYPDAIDVVVRALGPELESDELIGGGMEPFLYLPHSLFISEHGLEHFDLSMRAQRELTKRFSAELSIRAYIARDPERSFAYFREWARDPNPHVRRLVSEGTRLRLPWANRVAWLDGHPGRVVELLELLKDDPTTLVRRSVANNLNDLGKVHPELLASTCAAWRSGGPPTRSKLIEHALRSAIRRGEPAALSLLEYGERPAVDVVFAQFAPARVAVGGSVTITFELLSTSHKTQKLLVDLAVHFVKASGQTRPKVFKMKRVTLAPGARVGLEGTVSFAPMTTRRPFPGTHRFCAIVNGVSYHLASLELGP